MSNKAHEQSSRDKAQQAEQATAQGAAVTRDSGAPHATSKSTLQDASNTHSPEVTPSQVQDGPDANKQDNASPNDAPDKKEKYARSFISDGEKRANLLIYGGIDGVFNTISATSFSLWGSQTKLGRKLWGNPVNAALDKAIKPAFKLFKANPKGAVFDAAKGAGATFVSMVMGGMFTIPPLMWAERKDNKKAFTQYLDKKIYGEETVKNDPKFAQAYKEIDEAPEKDFGAGMWARAAVLFPIAAVVALIPSTSKFLEKNVHSHIATASKKMWDFLKITPKRWKTISPEMKKLGTTATTEEALHKTLSMEYLWVPIYAVFHAIAYNLFAKKRAETREEKEVQQQTKDTVSGEQTLSQAAAVTHDVHKDQETAKAEQSHGPEALTKRPADSPHSSVHKIQSLARQEIATTVKHATAY